MALRWLAHGCAVLAVLAALVVPATAGATTTITTVAGGGSLAIPDGPSAGALDVAVNNPIALTYFDYGPDWNSWMALRQGDTPGTDDPCVVDESYTTVADVGLMDIVAGQANECAAGPVYGTYTGSSQVGSNVIRLGHPRSIAPYRHNNGPAVLVTNTDVGRIEMFFPNSGAFTIAGTTRPSSCGGDTPPTPPDGVTAAVAQFCNPIALASTPNGPGTANDPPFAIGERGREPTASDRGHIYYVSGALPGTVKHITGSYHVAGLAFANNGDLLVADGIASILRITNLGSTPQVRTLGGYYDPVTDGYFTGFMDSDPDSFNQSRFNRPLAVTQGYDGAIYVADSMNCRIRKMPDSFGDATSPTIGNAVVTTIAGQACGSGTPPYGDGGPSTAARLDTPSGIAISPYGLLIADTGHDRIRLIDRTSILSAPPAFTSDATPDFEFASLDTPAHFKCLLDNNPTPFACPTPYTFDTLDDGQHTVQVWEDGPPADPTPATATFTVDTVAPTAPVLNSPAAGATDPSPQPKFSWGASSDVTTSVDHYELWIDQVKDSDVAVSACADGVCNAQAVAPLAERATPYTWQVRAVDKAGNFAPSEERNLYIGGPPAASLLINPNPALIGRTVTFDGSASSDPSGIVKYEWDLDGDGKFEKDTGTTPTTTRSFDAPATVPVSLRVTDGTGKTSKTTTSLKITAPGSAASLLGISINSGAQFTNDPNVKLLVKAPATASGVIVSNDGGFLAPSTFPIAQEVEWKLDSSGPERLPKTVYARFMLGPIISENYTDDIILDEIPPVVQQAAIAPTTAAPASNAARAAKARTYVLKVKAKDSNSGVSKVQVTDNKRKPGKLLAYKKKLAVKSAKRPKFLRARDRAGNFSKWKKLR